MSPASPSACVLFLFWAAAFWTYRLSFAALGGMCVAGSDVPAIERATARSGCVAPDAPSIAITSARMGATSPAEAMGSQWSAWPPARTTRNPWEDPSVTAYPGKLKFLPDRLSLPAELAAQKRLVGPIQAALVGYSSVRTTDPGRWDDGSLHFSQTNSLISTT